MQINYEKTKFSVHLRSSIEKHLFKQSIKKKIGKWIGKPYQKDPYLNFAETCLSGKDCPTVVDIGANIGTTVLPLAKQFPKGTFYAVEPHPIPASRFIKNCWNNHLSNVIFINAAIGQKEGFAQIYTCPSNSGGHRLTGFDQRNDLIKSQLDSIRVPVLPLKKLFQNFSIQSCDLLKIDVEGYEYFVLSSLEDLLHPTKVSNIVCEYGPEGMRAAGTDISDLLSIVFNQGYQCHLLDDGRKISDTKDLPKVPDFHVIDLVFSSPC